MSNANEPAAPLVKPDPHGGYPYVFSGLTKREAFAMAAMQGILATSGEAISVPAAAGFIGIAADDYDFRKHWPQACAVLAARHADALLAELDKTA